MNLQTLPRLALILAVFSMPLLLYAQQAEEETTLLTISGNLIGELDSLPANEAPDAVIDSYYALLAEETRSRLTALREHMDKRTEDYQVAFRSGDTAEMNETLDDLSFYWASIRTVHAQEFTDAAIAEITAAYSKLYRFLRNNN